MARREIEELRRRVDRIAGVSERLEALLPGLEELVHLRGNLDRLGPRLDVIDKVSAVLIRFLDANHEVSESVRVDVETISALGLQIEKSLAEVLAELRKSNGS